jgi:hypothetical protein
MECKVLNNQFIRYRLSTRIFIKIEDESVLNVMKSTLDLKMLLQDYQIRFEYFKIKS